MWFGRDQDSAYDLEAKAHGLLDAGRTDEARAIAEQLLSMGWSGGFEVKALAQQQAGELPGAIATLEEAVSKVPNLWHLWQLLGNLRSDAGDLDGALEAMNQALGCEAVSEPALRFNRAIVQHRRGEPGKALDDLEMIMALPRPPEFAEDVLSLAARCLSELGRAEDGLTLVEPWLAERPNAQAWWQAVKSRSSYAEARVGPSGEEIEVMGIEGAKVVGDFEKKRAEYLAQYGQE